MSSYTYSTPNYDLGNRTFIVTGGTQGVGEAIALHLAERGARGVTICGRNDDKGADVVTALTALGCEGFYVHAELAEEADCRRIVAAHAERFGDLFGLVNAAAITTRGTLDDTSVELWDRMFAVNTRAPFILMQESARVMKRGGVGGSIVNVLSMSAHGGQPFITAYCASKGALTASV
jgi:NAD(P)-dependent dehydrogenase (short-subunit alcohol dehydrogenase family)